MLVYIKNSEAETAKLKPQLHDILVLYTQGDFNSLHNDDTAQQNKNRKR